MDISGGLSLTDLILCYTIYVEQEWKLTIQRSQGKSSTRTWDSPMRPQTVSQYSFVLVYNFRNTGLCWYDVIKQWGESCQIHPNTSLALHAPILLEPAPQPGVILRLIRRTELQHLGDTPHPPQDMERLHKYGPHRRNMSVFV